MYKWSLLFFLAIGSSQAAQVAIVARMNSVFGLPEQTLNMATQRTQSDLLYVAPRIRTARGPPAGGSAAWWRAG